MINAGAIVTASLIKNDERMADRFDFVIHYLPNATSIQSSQRNTCGIIVYVLSDQSAV